MKATVRLKAPIIYFHSDLSAPAMSTNSSHSQVGVALIPLFQHILYHFTFPGFPFILIDKSSVF